MNSQNHSRALELVSLLLIVRSVVCAIEYLQYVEGFAALHGVFIYLFDAFLIWLNVYDRLLYFIPRQFSSRNTPTNKV